MNSTHKFINSIKALNQLGFNQVWNYAKYQMGLKSGYYRFRTPSSSINSFLPDNAFSPNWFYKTPKPEPLEKNSSELVEKNIDIANEIVQGNIRLFGGNPVPLKLKPDFSIAHWTFHERNKILIPAEDIKYIWEPARFGWAIQLGKAYKISNDDQYVNAFLTYLDEFRTGNPLNIGPNWQSGQEIALRLIALAISTSMMHHSKQFKKEDVNSICFDIADHAQRIIPTLTYAKAQNNNHLISEAAGLYTAGVFLESHPRSGNWKSTGRELFRKAILDQIDKNGEYCQHSTNYHRMMLTLALWMRYLLKSEGQDLEGDENEKLEQALVWLIGRFDENSGKATNLGHNDGSFVLPFTSSAFSDYRPIIQAAGIAFFLEKLLPDGPWNDLAIWLDMPVDGVPKSKKLLSSLWPKTRIGSQSAWANLRAVKYHNRPAHADQLCVDLWMKGTNVLTDAGTYLYNTQSPWENALASTAVHNTACIDGKDQMNRSGRFLWLDWAQAEVLDTSDRSIKAQHDGYLKLGIIHQREVKGVSERKWTVVDQISTTKSNTREHNIHINWLFPDWQYETEQGSISFHGPIGTIKMKYKVAGSNSLIQFNLIRAGESLLGEISSPNSGWFSPTYGEKIPAVSVILSINSVLPVEIISSISLLEEK